MYQIKGMLAGNTLLQLMVFLLEQRYSTGVPLITEQPRVVSVWRGKSVMLNCTITYNGSVDAWLRVSWYRTSPGGSVAIYQMNNSLCIPHPLWDGFKRCMVSLKIENVSFGHSVYDYTCEVKIPNVFPPIHVKGQGTQIQVYVPESAPKILMTQGDLIAEKACVLYCHALGFYPENITMQWQHPHNTQAAKSDANITTKLTPSKNSDGTFNAISQINFTPTLQDHGTVRTCQVLHTTSKQWIMQHVTLNVNYGPQLVIHYRNSIADQLQPLLQDIIYVEPQSYLQLNCTTDSNPISTVIWMKSGEHTERIQLTIGLSHSILQKEKIDDSFNGKYICRAYNSYGSKESSVRVYLTSDWESHFPVRFVTVPIFVMTVILLLLCCRKDRDCLCKWRNSKQHKDQSRLAKSDSPEDANSQKDNIITYKC